VNAKDVVAVVTPLEGTESPRDGKMNILSEKLLFYALNRFEMFESHKWKFYKLSTFLKGHNFCRIRLIVITRAVGHKTCYATACTDGILSCLVFCFDYLFVTSCGSVIGKH
jgi:hypothetical protein